jgi:hypothetical protein
MVKLPTSASPVYARFDAVTCSTTCRMRRSRGYDLAYLTTLPPDQARGMVHEALESDIAIARMAGASRREGRRERRGMPKVKRMKTARHICVLGIGPDNHLRPIGDD